MTAALCLCTALGAIALPSAAHAADTNATATETTGTTATDPTATAADTKDTAAAPLRDLAAAKGIHIGNAVAGHKLSSNAPYSAIAGTQFNSLTPENAMKWGSVEPTRGSYL